MNIALRIVWLANAALCIANWTIGEEMSGLLNLGIAILVRLEID